MPLADLLADDSNSFVAWHVQRNWSQQNTIAELQKRWPGQHPNTYYAAYNRGRAAASAGNWFNLLQADERLLAPQVPSSGPTVGDWRYYTEVQLQDLTTGDTATRMLRVDSPTSLTPTQLAQQADLLANTTFGSTHYSGRGGSAIGLFIVTDVNVWAVDRAIP